jgi:hypothetical protein
MSSFRATMNYDGHTRLIHFSWHICDAAVDARRRRGEAGQAVSAVLARDACEQHGLLWTSRWSVLTNVSNGQGSTTRLAKLVIQTSSPPRATGQIAPSRGGGFLLDDRGGYLLDDRGGRLLAQ